VNATASPLNERVAALFREARDLIRDEVNACHVIRLPALTAAGLEAAEAVVRVRPDLSVEVGRVLDRATCIPRPSRRRRVLVGLAKWLPGVPGHVRGQEQWFSVRAVRDVAAATAGGATEADVAGWLALRLLADGRG
jgi:hypothetical protein